MAQFWPRVSGGLVFRAYFTGVSVPANTNVTPTGLVDRMGGWDATNKRYAVPRSGDYLFFSHWKRVSSTASFSMFLMVNGTKVRNGADAGAAYGGAPVQDVLSLDAGDTVAVQFGVSWVMQSDAPAQNNWWGLVLL